MRKKVPPYLNGMARLRSEGALKGSNGTSKLQFLQTGGSRVAGSGGAFWKVDWSFDDTLAGEMVSLDSGLILWEDVGTRSLDGGLYDVVASLDIVELVVIESADLLSLDNSF